MVERHYPSDSTTGEQDDQTIELPNGDEVPAERAETAMPVLAEVEAEVDLKIEDGSVRMRTDGDVNLTVGVASNDLDPHMAVCSLFAPVEPETDDEVYGDIMLDDIEQVRELRDALTTALQYRGAEEVDE